MYGKSTQYSDESGLCKFTRKKRKIIYLLVLNREPNIYTLTLAIEDMYEFHRGLGLI